MHPVTARAEWKAHWGVPLAGALGYATSVIHIYGLGVYIEPISESFGWSRATTTFGMTIATLIQAVFGVPIGMLVDKIGPRILAVIGIPLTCAAFALLGTASGSAWQWYALWTLMALATLPVQATVWTAAVASRFARSRGLAFAITLCGASVAAALFPWLGARLIAAYGWQSAMAWQGLAWMALAWPVILVLFRTGRTPPPAKDDAPVLPTPAPEGVSFFEGLRSPVYLRLLVASLLFTFTVLALVVHFVPILTDAGLPPARAAALASLIGLFSIAGRLGTGLLLDRFPAAYVGAVIFLLPVASGLILLGAGAQGAVPVAVLIGLTLGAEVDVIVYLATRHFGLKAFGALYGGLLVALSVGTALGPLAASAVYDRTGGYDMFLLTTLVLMVAASLALFSLPRPAFGHE
ncbi:MFS transporter [Novosphingobium sp. MBES04]|uniref:MFS transporter n=1 Tax=Novosphingobium sp. MBES04 TaxID=1206458 RepID=UPI00057EA518|nr:MFS transporter [Novosphingobium sp. MBES04]GAM04290.1 monocarboxylate transporter 13-like [Novosphingobium sp. MBES04]